MIGPSLLSSLGRGEGVEPLGIGDPLLLRFFARILSSARAMALFLPEPSPPSLLPSILLDESKLWCYLNGKL